MASMKDYLEKAMLRLGSRGAMPDAQSIDYSGVTRFVAPCDGYAICAVLAGQNGDWLTITNGIQTVSYAMPRQNSGIETFLPTKKGATVSMARGETTTLSSFRFMKSVGGGGLKSLIFKLFPEVRHAYA